MTIVKIVKVGVGLAGFCAALFATGPAAAYVSLTLQPTGTGPWDWTLTGPIWKFEGADPAPLTTKYSTWGGIGWSPAAAHCIELATLPGLQTSNPDTRIWVRTAASLNADFTPTAYPGKTTRNGYTSVSDDFGGTLQSKIRIWIDRTSTLGSTEFYSFKIASYSAAHNDADFRVSTTRLDVTKAACTTSQSIPWVAISLRPRTSNSNYTNVELSSTAN